MKTAGDTDQELSPSPAPQASAGSDFGLLLSNSGPLLYKVISMPTETPSIRDRETNLQEWLRTWQPDPQTPYPADAQYAVRLARELMTRARDLQTPQERRQQAELDRMIHNPHDKVTLMQLTDQAFRSSTAYRAADQLIHILDVQGIPRFFAPVDRILLKGFQSFGNYLPGVAIPMVKEKMHQETANVILPAEREHLTAHLRNRRRESVRMNINFLGEALLGEGDAQKRLQRYLQALQMPDLEVLSVKISTIYSQISSLAYRHTIDVLADRLELLYRAAAKSTYRHADGRVSPKFVYLDMEEYRDMRLTADAFRQTLDRQGLKHVSAGIVLQAYIPDSFRVQRELTEWAQARIANGGAPITLRLVKGANMEMERFEACLNGWPQAPFKQKLQTDANYRRMVQYGMDPERARCVHLGIASHNLFEVAYALVLANQRSVQPYVQFEMLEGMANHQRRALLQFASNLLLYAPTCRREEFIYAIGYLVRRLDENTGPDNFLRHAFHLHVDSPDWRRLERQFFDAFDLIDDLSDAPRRTQNRNETPPLPAPGESPGDHPWQQFSNEPNTDFALPANVAWADAIIAKWHPRHGDKAIQIPLWVAGEQIKQGREVRDAIDPSRPGTVVGRYQQANADDIRRAIECAKRDPDGWRTLPDDERQNILRRAAHEIRLARGDLIGAAMAEGGKIIGESDPEVSEAVDFVEFYRASARDLRQQVGLRAQPRGVVVVVSPWNFPIAIPCGGVAAALAAGNTVILKPASATVLVAHVLCECFWRAGVSRRTLQLLPCSGGSEGRTLVSHPDVDTVILTGGTETALAMLDHAPTMRLLAETGGKNATIVTSLADRDQAIKDVVQSAFGHSGQKCSATSLLILDDEVYRDPTFQHTLCDAAASLYVGSAWDTKTKVGPLIRPPSGVLEKSLMELEEGESWALMPRRVIDGNQCLVSPAIKWDVQPGNFTHLTEFFGPVLGVMRADDLQHAIELANQTGFGLTAGLQSLDDREQQIWKEQLRAGNLYVNRGTTGAIVLRQPFGGMGKSAFGPGIKAGGPNYVASLMKFEDIDDPEQLSHNSDVHLSTFRRRLSNDSQTGTLPIPPLQVQHLLAALGSYAWSYEQEFGREHDHFRLPGQDNFRRYRPVRELRIRVHPDDTPFEILARICAAKSIGCHITVSTPPTMESAVVDWLDQATEDWGAGIEFVEETDDSLRETIMRGHTFRIRYAAPDRVPIDVRRTANEAGVYVADAPVLRHGRIELLWYVEEQSISDNYHRYGNLGDRADEPRQEPQ